MKILKIETLEKGKWFDSDTIILHAVFQILTDFVEKEKPFEKINWNSDDGHKFAAKEIKSLYDWWKNKRPKRIDPVEAIDISEVPSLEFEEKDDGYVFKEYDKKKYKKWIVACKKSEDLEVKWDKEDKENIKRVVDIMSYMWT